MRKLAMLFLVATTLATGTLNASVAYAEPPNPCFYDDDFEFLNPQPLPP